MSRVGNYEGETGLTEPAWLPSRGRGSASLTYQYLDTNDHLYSGDVTGRRFPGGYTGQGRKAFLGETVGQVATIDADYGVRDRLAVSGSLAFVASRYSGSGGHAALPGRPKIDDGKYHPTFQDATLGVRYLAWRRPLAVVPFLRFTFPTNDYVDVGHSAVGRHLNALTLGATLARNLDPLLRNAYFKATLDYSFVEGPSAETPAGVHVEQIEALNINRRHASFEAGYLVTPRLTLSAYGDFFHTEDGIDWREDLATPEDLARVGHVHDAAAKDRHSTVGAVVAFSIRPGSRVYGAFSRTIRGTNTHGGNAFSLGVSKVFGRRKVVQPSP